MNNLQNPTLPSRFQVGDTCIVQFGESLIIEDAEINRVSFTKNRVLYDVFFKTPMGLTSIEGLNSLLVHPKPTEIS